MDESLLVVEKIRPPPPPPSSAYTLEEESRLRRQIQRISISHSVSVTYSILLGCAAMIVIILTLFFANTISMELRIWLGSVNGILILALQIMLCIYAKDPVFAIHFMAVLMFMSGIGFTLSSLHLFYGH